METFAPGDIVYARGREWIALPSPEAEWLCLRPLSGSESDARLLHPKLEREAVRAARFDLPDLSDVATQDAARLLSDALHLSMRRGAGPFRSAGRLAFAPRAYQLVPLLMALRLPTVRLLIADDVGIGKTIEAGLILRELIDRGEIDRFSVLCPPHLVEQWRRELEEKFDLDATAVTAASAPRLERNLPASQSIFEAYPYTVVSLDYIKADKRRDGFARACPSLVVVDEAHACVGTHLSRQQRFDLLQSIAKSGDRHMILLTATPHSGDEPAFGRLLGLLDPEFASGALEDEAFRVRLARHFVQRRRIDITGRDWGEARAFPQHETADRPYNLNGEHKAFHEAVLDYCLGVVEGAGADQRSRRLAFWGTLALMRCVGSSPAAAASALRNRLAADPTRLEEQVFDEDGEDSDAVDVEPNAGLEQAGPLADLARQAERLTRAPDPKLGAVIELLKPLIEKGANPVVFCRFIATADHVASGLRKAFPRLRIDVVTGDLPSDERRARVDAMEEADQRLLVATDCLSEGVNLQRLFDAVIHYDLSWNPTRHQQREGRGFLFAQGAETMGHARKTTGSYYTPDSLVKALLDSALDPVLDRVERDADDPATALLALAVIDPACSSGHFLLAAARRIAARVARARAGGVASTQDFRHALRDVARLCIHGVDRNPMAVELTKVALWIETVEPGKPLGILGANIRCGDALPGVARFVYASLSELYPALERLYRLGVSLPDNPLVEFRKRTAELPRTTEAERMVVQRVGQDLFRTALLEYWNHRCPLTGISEPALLRASHIVPWAECDDDAHRLDVHNGLLLSALWDAAFDAGLVGFSDEGDILLHARLNEPERKTLLTGAAPRVSGLTGAHLVNLARHRRKAALI